MNIVTIITLVVFAAYGLHIGLIPSISDSYRTIKNKSVYHIFFGLVGLLMWLQNIYPASDSEKLLAMLAGFFMWSISLAPQFWRDEQKVYHPLFTYIAIVLGLAWVTIHIYPEWYWWAPSAVLISGAYFLRNVKNSTLWTEYLAAVVIFTPTL